MFRFRRRDLKPLLAELDQWRELLDQRGALPRTWAGRLRRDLESEAVAASTSMEGVPVTVEEVRRILAGERPREVSATDADLVLGYREAMGLALRRSDDPGFHWTTELLVSVHDRVLAGRFDLGAGRLRTGPARLADRATGRTVFEAAPAARVPALLGKLFREVEREPRHPAELAAWIHVGVAAIHPFGDGNGRTARVASSLAMLRGGFKLPEFTSLEEWWGHHLPEYYEAFHCLGARFNENADVTPFLLAHLRAQVAQVRALDLREQVQRGIWTAIEEVLVGAGLPARLANALWDAFFDREVTSRYYRSLTDVSQASAASDLTSGVAAGLLLPIGAGRSRAYRAGSRLMGEIGRVQGIEVTADGEAGRSVITGVLADRAASVGLRAKLRGKALPGSPVRGSPRR
jgi:Fic family protein